MTFADYCLFAIASSVLQGPGVTVSFACEFLDAAREGELVEGDGEITRAGGSLIFLRGVLKSGERSLFTFSGTIKRVKWKKPAGTQAPLPPDAPQARRGWRDYALLLALACCWSSTYPLTKIGLGSIPPITFISARSLIAAVFLLVILRVRGIADAGRRKGLEAVRPAADHQFDDPVPDDHLGAAICAGGNYGGAGLDDADLRLPHHLGHHAARAGHAAEACRRHSGACRHRRDHRPRCAGRRSTPTSSPRSSSCSPPSRLPAPRSSGCG